VHIAEVHFDTVTGRRGKRIREREGKGEGNRGVREREQGLGEK